MAGADRKKPALIGGLIVGVLSLLPYIKAGNYCFCLWALVGGAVAAKLLIDRSPEPLTAAEGATIGLMAGLIGGGMYLLIDAPLTALNIGTAINTFKDYPGLPPEARVFYEKIQQSLALKVIVSFLGVFLAAVVLVAFTVLGGLLGVVLFEKRKGQAPPPPPPQYPPPYSPNYPPTPPPSAPPPGGYGGESGGESGGEPPV